LRNPDYKDYFPTAVSDSNYMGNGAILGKNICRARAPADIIYLQENYDRENTAWCRPVKWAQPNFYTYWHWTESGREWYACNHREGSNLVFCDGHAEWRHYKALRSGDFGLIPAGDDYKASNGKTYTSAF
jgi:prepilin-type processing-associated H-X9-DG protein